MHQSHTAFTPGPCGVCIKQTPGATVPRRSSRAETPTEQPLSKSAHTLPNTQPPLHAGLRRRSATRLHKEKTGCDTAAAWPACRGRHSSSTPFTEPAQTNARATRRVLTTRPSRHPRPRPPAWPWGPCPHHPAGTHDDEAHTTVRQKPLGGAGLLAATAQASEGCCRSLSSC